ncbi:MAG: glycosyltransferase family A protein [Patescibacteria group bacterium]|nr:glycosyltransferase family A protein [Patescibacteria group bacterium]
MKISVVIPVHNESAEVEGCLESLKNQLRPADEIIVVDNNCTDDTITKARRYNIHIVNQKKQGIWPSRTAGNNAATGDIIAFADCDSRMPEEWLQKIEQTFLSDSTIIAVTGPGKFYDSNYLGNALAYYSYMVPYFLLVGSALGTRPLFASNAAMRASAWKNVRNEVHNDSDAVHDDIDLTYHLLCQGKIYYDKNNPVLISTRPFKHPLLLIKRYSKALHTLRLHWPKQSPRKIYEQKLRQR